MDATSTYHDLSVALAAYISTQAGRKIEVDGLARLSDGWESDVYAFDALQWHQDSPDGNYVLRLFFGANAGDKALHEFRAYQLLARAGYPVPRVDLVEPDTQPLGRAFLVMQRIGGVSMGMRWRDPDPVVQTREMARFCKLFATLHTLAWQHLAGAEHVPIQTLAQQFDFWEGLISGLGVDSFAAGLAWLRAASEGVTPQPPGLVHWDFHHENILIDSRDDAWVIDWTQFQATDVRLDLAWTLVVLASERSPETAQRVRAGYLGARGWTEADVAADLSVFEAAACLKRIGSVMVSLRNGADAVGMRPGAEAIMASRLARISTVYQRWLQITDTPLADADKVFAAYL